MSTDVELYDVDPAETASKVETVVRTWVNDGFCRLEEILILSPHRTKAKTSLANYSKIGEWPMVYLMRERFSTGAMIVVDGGSTLV
jgi:hypothetical protein